MNVDRKAARLPGRGLAAALTLLGWALLPGLAQAAPDTASDAAKVPADASPPPAARPPADATAPRPATTQPDKEPARRAATPRKRPRAVEPKAATPRRPAEPKGPVHFPAPDTGPDAGGASDGPGLAVKKAHHPNGEASTANKFDPDTGSATKKAWRGSQFIYTNTFTLISLAPEAALTYNPTYSMNFSFRPRWWFNKMFYARGLLDVTRELTNSDETTYAGEAWLGDLTLQVGASKFYTIPKAKIAMSADVAFTFPTSKASMAATLVMGIGPRLRLSRTFKVLKALIVGANLRVTGYFHRYSTKQRETSLISTCSPGEANCGAFLNMGTRNRYLRVTPSLDITLVILKWLGASLAYGWMVDDLYGITDTDQYASTYTPQEAQNKRYYSYFGASVFFDPMEWLEINLQYLTYTPQLAPDSSYYNPFFNRYYSTLSLDLILRVDGLVALFGGK